MTTKDNVVLIGMPGAGKSTLGVVIAKIMGYDFVDGDLLIQNQCDKTLQKIIDGLGPEGFIQVENEVLCAIERHRCVISPGGSAIYSNEAMQHLSSIGHVVYLHVPLDELETRLGGLHERGVVMKHGSGMDLAEIYAEREPLYKQWAEITIDTAGLDTRTAAQAVVDALSAVV